MFAIERSVCARRRRWFASQSRRACLAPLGVGRAMCGVLVLGMLTGLMSPAALWSAEPDAAPPRWAAPLSDAHAAIAVALGQPADGFEFQESPLTDAVVVIADRHNLRVDIDRRALEDAGVSTDTPITFQFRGLTLGESLNRMLGELDLACVPGPGYVLITTRDEAQTMFSTRVYDLRPLVARLPGWKGRQHDWDELINTFRNSVASESWDVHGGVGAIYRVGTSLVISQTDELHSQIQRTLDELWRAHAPAQATEAQTVESGSTTAEQSATSSPPETRVFELASHDAEQVRTAVLQLVAPDSWEGPHTLVVIKRSVRNVAPGGIQGLPTSQKLIARHRPDVLEQIQDLLEELEPKDESVGRGSSAVEIGAGGRGVF
jgi:hypothetical protein